MEHIGKAKREVYTEVFEALMLRLACGLMKNIYHVSVSNRGDAYHTKPDNFYNRFY